MLTVIKKIALFHYTILIYINNTHMTSPLLLHVLLVIISGLWKGEIFFVLYPDV